MNEELVQYLGKHLNSIEIKTLFEKLGAPTSIQKHDDRTYYSYDADGLAFVFNMDLQLLSSIQLFSNYEAEPDVSEYQGLLPGGAIFSDSKATVIHKLGKPEKENSKETIIRPILGKVMPWVRYRYPNYLLHFQFSEDESRITMVSLRYQVNGEGI